MAEDKNRDYVQAKLITGEYAQVARKASAPIILPAAVPSPPNS